MDWNKFKYVFIITIVFLLNCLVGAHAKTSSETQDLKELLPPSNWMTGWKWENEPQYYYPDDLFEYINGNADLYIAYDFRALVTVTFINENDLSLVVDIYDMETPLNAFGIYSNYRSPESHFQSIGTEAIVSEYHTRFYQGSYVIDLNASDATEDLSEFMTKTAEEISKRITDSKEPPEIIALLPTAHLINKTPKYISEGLLGHQFFPRGLEAKYRLGSNEVKAFIVLCESNEDAEKAYTSFTNYICDKGEELDQLIIGDQLAISGKVPYHQYALAVKINRYVYGLLDLPGPDQGVDLMKALQQQMASKIK